MTFPKQATAKASDPCDRRSDETASAYARFCLYQSLPAYRRSLSAVARVCGVTRQSIQQQATRHEWELRVGPPNYLGAITALSYGGKHPLLELLEERERDLQKQEVTDPDTGFDLAFLEDLEEVGLASVLKGSDATFKDRGHPATFSAASPPSEPGAVLLPSLRPQ